MDCIKCEHFSICEPHLIEITSRQDPQRTFVIGLTTNPNFICRGGAPMFIKVSGKLEVDDENGNQFKG